MQTIKTSLVVILLITVCYGAFVALNAPEPNIPDELRDWANGDVDEMIGIEMPSDTNSPAFQRSETPSALPSALSPNSLSQGPARADSALPTADLPKLDIPPLASPNEPLAADQSSVSTPAFPEIPAFPGDAIAGRAPGLSGQLPADPGAPAEGPSMPLNQLEMPQSGPRIDLAGSKKTVTDVPLDMSGESLEQPLLAAESKSQTSAAASETSSQPEMPYEIAREQALAKAAAGSLQEALAQMTPYYEHPELGHDEHLDLVDLLDALSRETIYSNRHRLLPAYTVEVNDTLESVAAVHRITPELLAAINAMGEHKALIAGSRIKVVQGPFRARISLTRGELTLFLGECYAGRFPVTLGTEIPAKEGVYSVTDRRRDRIYYGTGGVVCQAGDPANPYGNHWISLADNLCIHGSPEMARSDLKQAGCVSLAPLDAADVYNILTLDSQVEIRR